MTPNTQNRLIHHPDRYDATMNLRIPVTLWCLLAFLLRHLLLLGITFMPTTGQEITLLRDLIRPEYVIADLIALPVFVSAIRRRPEASRWFRRIWSRARLLLSTSLLLYLALFVFTLAQTPGPLDRRLSDVGLISVLFNLAGLLYLWRSPLLVDLFQDWPRATKSG